MRAIYLFSILSILFTTSTYAGPDEDFCFNTPYEVSFTANSPIYNLTIKSLTMNERNKIIKVKREACEENAGRLSVIKRYTTVRRTSLHYTEIKSSAIVSCNLR
jgi:hypothetical protein